MTYKVRDPPSNQLVTVYICIYCCKTPTPNIIIHDRTFTSTIEPLVDIIQDYTLTGIPVPHADNVVPGRLWSQSHHMPMMPYLVGFALSLNREAAEMVAHHHLQTFDVHAAGQPGKLVTNSNCKRLVKFILD